MDERYTLIVDSQTTDTIFINSNTSKKVEIEFADTAIFSFGKASHRIKVIVSDQIRPDQLSISENVIRLLKIPLSCTFEFRKNNNHELILGPFIGILFDLKKKNAFKQLNYYVRSYEEIGGAILAFSFEGININAQTIKGYLYNPVTRKWDKGIYKYPASIFIKRVLPAIWQFFFETLFSQRYYNSIDFNKWQMYNWLAQNTDLQSYLPITILYKKPEDIFTFLDTNKSSSAYIKPINGLKGKGIKKIIKNGDNIYVSYRHKHENVQLEFVNKDQAAQYFSENLSKGNYLIQQTLDLQLLSGQLVDFRIILVKDIWGQWKVLESIGRRGVLDSVVSNRSAGGQLELGENLLKQVYQLSDDLVHATQKKLFEVAIKAAQTIDDSINLTMGRYGIDLAIDRNNKIWLIEINPRPNDYIAFHAQLFDLFYKIKLENMLYAKRLAGFFPFENKAKSLEK